jgi:hypothetical protein
MVDAAIAPRSPAAFLTIRAGIGTPPDAQLGAAR